MWTFTASRSTERLTCAVRPMPRTIAPDIWPTYRHYSTPIVECPTIAGVSMPMEKAPDPVLGNALRHFHSTLDHYVAKHGMSDEQGAH